ncbi:protein NUCLEAR FUSION DEFECTIVE 6, chloroplastic/mitochondrial [Ananas comosus]|uniref:Protein NUCLEAR FUSION DEFECTIVE 6, chloroplastic/mitochondrial n=1 Tax=Ananas comosus TaxID=4615 RepID=A0A6P5EN67_ANACO|nr:protein NUCLEAR FUSION DEFECTIVE 6, chloroplastic/mitochondrial [Ananas comosus]
MATLSRYAARSAAAALRSATLLPKPSCSSGVRSPLIRRSMAAAAALGSVESLMPLHSAVASARLRSFIAVDSSCWSWLSQGRALPL